MHKTKNILPTTTSTIKPLTHPTTKLIPTQKYTHDQDKLFLPCKKQPTPKFLPFVSKLHHILLR